jgi:hypothetical protein
MSLLRRLTIPLVLAFFGLPLIQIGWEQLKRGHFTYTSQAGEVQTFSPSENAGVFWGFSVGLCVAGVILLVAAVYLFFRLRPFHTRGLSRRDMPIGLRLLTFACFGFALFLPLSLLPFGHRIIGGKFHSPSFGGGVAVPLSLSQGFCFRLPVMDFYARGAGPVICLSVSVSRSPSFRLLVRCRMP